MVQCQSNSPLRFVMQMVTVSQMPPYICYADGYSVSQMPPYSDM